MRKHNFNQYGYVGDPREIAWDLHAVRQDFQKGSGVNAVLLRLGFQIFGALFDVPLSSVESLYKAGFRAFKVDRNHILGGLTIEIVEEYSPFAAVFL